MTYTRPFEVTDDMQASSGQRLANYILDVIIQYIIYFVLIMIISIIAGSLGATSVPYWVSGFSGTVLFLVFMISYYTLTESYFSRSFAKYITKTMVVMEDGSKPDWQTIFRRSLCRLIPFEIFSFLGSYGRGWHDTISDTYVVKKDIFEREKELFYSFDEIGKTQE